MQNRIFKISIAFDGLFFATKTDLNRSNCSFNSFYQDFSIMIKKLTWLISSKLSFNIIKIVEIDVSIDSAFSS